MFNWTVFCSLGLNVLFIYLSVEKQERREGSWGGGVLLQPRISPYLSPTPRPLFVFLCALRKNAGGGVCLCIRTYMYASVPWLTFKPCTQCVKVLRLENAHAF